jgi:hypothetical protein
LIDAGKSITARDVGLTEVSEYAVELATAPSSPGESTSRCSAGKTGHPE